MNAQSNIIWITVVSGSINIEDHFKYYVLLDFRTGHTGEAEYQYRKDCRYVTELYL
jgi:hypothetical protein